PTHTSTRTWGPRERARRRRGHAGRDPRRGTAVHQAFPRRDRGGEVRRSCDDRPGSRTAVRAGRGADALGRPAAGRGARRRAADQRADGAPRDGARVPRRPPGDRRRQPRRRPDGARGQDQPRHRLGDQCARPARGWPQRRGRGIAPRHRPPSGPRLRRRRRRGEPGDPRPAPRRVAHPGRVDDRGRRGGSVVQHQRRHGRWRDRRGARRREDRLPHRRRGVAGRRRRSELADRPDDGEGAARDARPRRADRRDDPEDRSVRARGAQRRAFRPHPRWAHPARPAARTVHRSWHRHDDHGGLGVMTTRPESHLMATYPPQPVTFVRGEGTRLFDDQGKEYLDFLCGLAVTSLGHANPAVAEAISTQARELLHVSNLFGTVPGEEVAATLDRLLDAGDGRVFFCNSGAEANECAIKLARRFGGRGRHAVVSAYGSFHGRTLATLHATGQPQKHEPFQPLPEGFRHVAWDDIEALTAAIDGTTAAVLLEPIQGEGGVHPATPEYFHAVRELCDERNLLFIVDEVQTGLGRTGKWFGFEHLGVRPDVVTMAKALGNGVPIGACWARAEVADAFVPGDHATTFGGQPLAASAARAVLKVMEEEDVPVRAAAAGHHLAKALEAIPHVDAVRGLGLLLAAELDQPIAKDVAARCLEAGLVLNAVNDTSLRLAPPLLVSDDEIDEAAAILAGVLGS